MPMTGMCVVFSGLLLLAGAALWVSSPVQERLSAVSCVAAGCACLLATQGTGKGLALVALLGTSAVMVTVFAGRRPRGAVWLGYGAPIAGLLLLAGVVGAGGAG